MNRTFWSDKCVFLTGHTGFKGGWLALWLADMGAKVHGYALAPPVNPSLFNVVKLQDSLASSTVADIRDATTLVKAMHEAAPDIVFRDAEARRIRSRRRSDVRSRRLRGASAPRSREPIGLSGRRPTIY